VELYLSPLVTRRQADCLHLETGWHIGHLCYERRRQQRAASHRQARRQRNVGLGDWISVRPDDASQQRGRAVFEDGTLDIAVVLPLSGDLQAFGEDIYNGAVIAAEFYRLESGNKVNFTTYDTKGDPVNAAQIIRNLANSPVDIVLGPLTSEERVELDRLATELEQDEWVALQPALERMHLEREQLEQEHRQARAESAALAILMTWQEALLTRARAINSYTNILVPFTLLGS